MTTPAGSARPGRACPPFSFTSVRGLEVGSRSLLGKRALVVVFAGEGLRPDMEACWDDLAQRYPNDLAIVLVTASHDQALRDAPYVVTSDGDEGLATAFGPPSVPAAYFVRRDGLVTRHAQADDPLLTDPAAFRRLAVALVG